MDLFSYLLGKKSSSGGGSSGDLDWSAIGYDSTPQAIVDSYNYAKQIYDNWDNTQTRLSQKFKDDKQLCIMPLVDTSNAKDTQSMFYNCSSLIEIPQLDTSKVTNMSNMFFGCMGLTTIPLLNTSKVTSTSYMFNSCQTITTIPLLDTNLVSDMGGMFNQCNNLATIPQLNTSSTYNMDNMFTGCISLSDTSLDNILQMCINVNPLFKKTKTLYSMGIRNTTYYPTSRIEALPSYQDFINAGWTIGY